MPDDHPPDDHQPDGLLDDDGLLGALASALRAPDRSPAADRVADLRRQVEQRGLVAAVSAPAPATDEVTSRRSRREVEQAGRRRSRRALLRGGAAAAIGTVVGAAGVLALTSGDEGEEPGPPTQPVAFAAVPTGLRVTGRTIDHTWGMELLLDVQGLPAGAEYEVRYTTAAGPVAAGGFVAVDVPMHCRFNGTALRSAVTAVDVVDTATGTSVLTGTIA